MQVYQKTVPTPGTAVQLTTASLSFCQGLIATAEKANMAANTGAVYLGLKGMSKTTGAGVIAKIASGGSFTIYENGPMAASALYVDADTANDGVRVVFP